MKISQSSFLQNSLIVVVSLVVSILLAEIGLRIFSSEPPAGTEEIATRYFWTSPSMIVDSYGAVRLAPNTLVQETCVADGQVEFDVQYRTNNLGLVDTVDYSDSASGPAVVVIGDSYTAGTGARPWFPTLRESLASRESSLNLYNLGMVGIGVQHFEKSLESFLSKREATHIVFLVIANDFNRIEWVPISDREGLRICHPEKEEECLRDEVTIPLRDVGESSKDLIRRWKLRKDRLVQRVSKERAERLKTNSTIKQVSQLIMSKSHLLMKINGLRHSLFDEPPGMPHLENNVKALMRLGKRYSTKKMMLLQFPSKMDISASGRSLSLERYAQEAGMSYMNLEDICHFSKEMYHRHDAHFTSSGYETFSKCVAQALQQFVLDES